MDAFFLPMWYHLVHVQGCTLDKVSQLLQTGRGPRDEGGKFVKRCVICNTHGPSPQNEPHTNKFLKIKLVSQNKPAFFPLKKNQTPRVLTGTNHANRAGLPVSRGLTLFPAPRSPHRWAPASWSVPPPWLLRHGQHTVTDGQ